MYCWNCGSKNPDDHRFCGQCGKVLLRPVEERQSSILASGVTSTSSLPEKQTNPLIEEPRLVRESVRVEPRPYEPVPHDPTINGHGMGQEGSRAPLIPSPLPRPYSSSQRDEARTEFRSSAYSGPSVLGLGGSGADDLLLEDDEDDSERSSGRRLVALLILVVLGILVWKQWSVIKSNAQEYMGSKQLRATEGQQQATVAPSSPAASAVRESQPAPTEGSTTPAGRELADAAAGKIEEKVSKPEDDRGAEKQPDTKSAEKSADTKSEEAVEPIIDVASRREQQARAAAKPQYDSSQVELAQRYLQGKGVPQDCGRGISLLRSAARQPNPKAQIQLGALYATGKCVTQDRAMAYRWFAQAQELEPANSWINRNLNALWANMSSDERRRAEDGFDRQD